MKSFLAKFSSAEKPQPTESNVTIAGPLANIVSKALQEVYSTEFKVDESQESEVEQTEIRPAGESQQTNAIDNAILLKEIEQEDIDGIKNAKNSGHTTIYSISKSQLNELTVKELTKRINNANGSQYMRNIDGYYSDLHLVLIDDYGMPSWFNSAVGNIERLDQRSGYMLSIDNFAKVAHVPVYNTFGACVKAIANNKVTG